MSDGLHNPYTGEVPFPFMGEGFSLRLRTGDLGRLRGRYGAPVNAKPEFDERGRRVDWFWDVLIVGIQSHDPVVMVDVLRAALKKNGGKTPVEMDFEDLPFALAAIDEALMDAVMLSRWGKTAAQVAEEYRETAAAVEAGIAAAADPLTGPETAETTSTESSGPDTEQASTQPNAGI